MSRLFSVLFSHGFRTFESGPSRQGQAVIGFASKLADFHPKWPSVSLKSAPTLILLLAGLSVDAAPPQDVQWRQVGILETWQSCPTPTASSQWAVASVKLGDELYCIFDFFGRSTTTPLTTSPSLNAVGWQSPPAQDSLIVQPMSNALSDAIWRSLEARFEHGAGRVDLPLVAGHEKVRISVIDTSPSSISPLPQSSPHGLALNRFLEHLLCNAFVPCIFQGAPELALGYTDADSAIPSIWNADQGGYVGLLSDLALAIVRALNNWDSENFRLILNLSVAWDDALSNAAEENSSPLSNPERMVQAAIREAVCRGVLVITAAGNQFDVDHADGPLLPAAWETVEAPEECQTSGSIYQPLVYAVGGVETDDLPLANSRDNARPPLVAYGEAAATESSDLDIPTATLTGTSVSALVASATAAAVWYYFPHLSAAEVMDQVYASGKVLPGSPPPDFCLDGPGFPSCFAAREPTHRVNICDAVRWACAAQDLGGGCPTPLDPASPDPCPKSLPAWDPSSISVQTMSGGTDPLPQNLRCELAPWLYDSSGPAPVSFCPSKELTGLGARPWVGPQPNSDPCPNCHLDKDDNDLFVEIDPGFSGSVTSATLTYCGSHLVLNNLFPLIPGVPIRIKTPSIGLCSSASLSFAVIHNQGDLSTLSPVLVVP